MGFVCTLIVLILALRLNTFAIFCMLISDTFRMFIDRILPVAVFCMCVHLYFYRIIFIRFQLNIVINSEICVVKFASCTQQVFNYNLMLLYVIICNGVREKTSTVGSSSSPLPLPGQQYPLEECIKRCISCTSVQFVCVVPALTVTSFSFHRYTSTLMLITQRQL